MLGFRWCAWLPLLVACGGNIEGGSGSPDSERPSTQAPEGSSKGDADTELGACKLGRKEDNRAPCPWVADGACYDDREMACNCACPRSGTSQCVSGFDDGPEGHVWVTCG